MDSVVEDAIQAGLVVFVQEGSTLGQKTFTLTTTGAITIGVTQLTFAELGGGGGITPPATSTLNAIALWGDALGTSLLDSTIVVDAGHLQGAGSLRVLQSATTPTNIPGNGVFWARSDDAPVFTTASGVDQNLSSWSPNKRPVVVASTANVDLAVGGLLTVDGVALTTGDRVLVWNQTVPLANGIYVASAGSWSRASDFDDAVQDHIEAGISVYVQQGDSYSRTVFTLVTTGAITINTSSLEFIPMGGLARTDATSTEVIAALTPFTAGAFVWSAAVNMRDHNALAVYFNPEDLGTNTIVDLVLAWSDDGTTIPFSAEDNILCTDYNITGFSDGSFNPKPYTVRLTTAGGELVAGTMTHLVYPKGGGVCRVGVKGVFATGTFGLRTQRLVR